MAAIRERARQQQEAEAAAENERYQARIALFAGDCAYCFDTGVVYQTIDVWCQCAAGEKRRADYLAALSSEIIGKAQLTPRVKKFTLDSYPTKGSAAYKQIRAYIAGWDGERGLILIGQVGVGKTGLVVSVIRALVDRYVEQNVDNRFSVRFVSGVDLMDELKATFANHTTSAALESFQRVKLLVLDDLGIRAEVSEWQQEQLFSIINHRYEYCLPTICTTNCDLPELERRIGERVLWRLVETGDVLRVTGPNLRDKAVSHAAH